MSWALPKTSWSLPSIDPLVRDNLITLAINGGLTFYSATVAFNPTVGICCAVAQTALAYYNPDSEGLQVAFFPLQLRAIQQIKVEVIRHFFDEDNWQAQAFVLFAVSVMVGGYFAGFQNNQLAVQALDIALESQAQIIEYLWVVIIKAPIVEEVLFRGFFLGSMRNLQIIILGSETADGVIAKTSRIFIQAIGFGAMHYSIYQDFGTNVLITLMASNLGMYFGHIKERHNHLWPTTGIHAGVNAIATSFHCLKRFCT